MVDSIGEKERSRVMSLVKQKNTRPEMLVRSFLHRKGLRYRIHEKSLPGKPDIVFSKLKLVIFVHGCFWHGHNDPCCKLARTPKSKIDYWKNKVEGNRQRDARNMNALEDLGWKVLIIRECELSRQVTLEQLYLCITKMAHRN